MIKPLTSIRFFFAFMVVVFHSRAMLQESFLQNYPVFMNFVETGFVGVSFFFVLSGFILIFSYKDKCQTAVERKSFWIARFARIYPMYAMGLVVLIILFCIQTVLGSHYFHDGIPDLLSQILLLQAWIPTSIESWNRPTWSLSAEMLFYLCFPYILAATKNSSIRTRGFIFASCFFLSQIAPLVGSITGITTVPANAPWPPQSGSEIILSHFVLFNPIFHLPAFIFGMMLAFIFEKQKMMFIKWGNEFLWGGLSGLFIFLGLLPSFFPCAMYFNGLLMPFIGALIVGLGSLKNKLSDLLSARWLVVLGESSYALYVIHYPIMQLLGFSKVYERFYQGYPLAYCLSFYALAILASVAFFKIYELPARRWIRIKFDPVYKGE